MVKQVNQRKKGGESESRWKKQTGFDDVNFLLITDVIFVFAR